MYNVTLIATRHENLGNCNSDELLQILIGLNPDVIFEEIPPSMHNEYYVQISRSNLESTANNKFIQNHKVKQVAVDSNDVPPKEFFKTYERIQKRVAGSIDQSGFDYRTLVDRDRESTYQHGFKYLNSILCDNVHFGIEKAIESGLMEINDDALIQAFKTWNEVQDRRENFMLERIYEYSHRNKYENAIFTVGSAHRRSLMEKIADVHNSSKTQLNWTFYNDHN